MIDVSKLKLSVGQVVLLLIVNKRKLFAVQVVEEINRKTIADGEFIDYLVSDGEDRSQPMSLKSIEDKIELFTSITDLRVKLIENATAAIDIMIGDAVNTASTRFPSSKLSSQLTGKQSKRGQRKVPEKESVEDENIVTLENGQKARIRISESMADLMGDIPTS